MRAYALIILLTFLAWAPLCARYTPVADDLTQKTALDQGFWHYWPEQYHRQGVWRLVGIWLYGVGADHPLAYGPAAIAAHAAVSCLFLCVATKLLGGEGLPLVLAVVFAVFPFGGQAVYSAAADALIVMQGLFFLNLLIFLRWGSSPRKQLACLAASFFLALLADFVQENLLVTFMASGLILWMDRPLRELGVSIRSRFCVIGPMAAGVVFTVLFKLTQPPHPNKTMGFRAQPLLSGYFYQYANYYVLEPWASSVLRGLIFWRWSAAAIGAAVISGAAAAIAGVAWTRKRRSDSSDRPALHILIYLVILSLANNAVFMVAGGYSVDSRKRYAMLPVLLLIAGWIWRRAMPRLPRAAPAVVAALAVLGAPSTWLNIEIWRYESHRYSQLLETICAARPAGPIEVKWNPNIYTEWPHAGVTWGDPLDAPITLDGPMQLCGMPTLTELDARPGPVTVFEYDPAKDHWDVEHNP